jgi:hypothetical protein
VDDCDTEIILVSGDILVSADLKLVYLRDLDQRSGRSPLMECYCFLGASSIDRDGTMLVRLSALTATSCP